ncbi:hypothetical protein diail_2140 [Diaporthe ilicicola]|nr:hypothetical protein diail_2140 [Diaporthe ilicicola]
MHPVKFALLSSLAGLSLAAPPSQQVKRQTDQSGWNPPSDLAQPLKEVWDHCEKTYAGGDLYSFKNYGWDQIMATKGVINYCVRWDSDEAVPASRRDVIALEVDAAYQKWFKWVYGWDNFPYTTITVKVVGWAVKDKSLLQGSTDGLDIYTDVDADGIPQCAPECGRFFHTDGDYSLCAAGEDRHYDQSIWLTPGFEGGAGGDWGQRVATELFMSGLNGGDMMRYILHEQGHSFGLDDFMDWTPSTRGDDFLMSKGWISSSINASRNSPPTFQIQKFLNTVPGSEPFAGALAAGPPTDRCVNERPASEPEKYMTIEACKASEGFKEPRLLFEHIWRKHSRFYRCGYCSHRWSISKSRTEVKQEKEEHWKYCGEKLRGARPKEFDENGIELLDHQQQRLFERIKSTKDVAAKLGALYEACRKPVPETYHATAPYPAMQPQMAYEYDARTATYYSQASMSHSGGFLEGFTRVDPGPSSPTRTCPTINNVSVNATLQASDESQVSGADRSRDVDSGYGSLGSVDPALRWPHGASAEHVTVSSPEYLVNPNDCAPIHNHDGQSYHRRYRDNDSGLYGGAGPSTRRDHSLLGLAPLNPEPQTAGEATNFWSFSDFLVE